MGISRIGLPGFIFVAMAVCQTPVVPEGAVLNGASFERGAAVTPGSIVSIFGTELASGLAQADSIPLSTSLGGVSVTFNTIPAPLYFVSPGQINAQLPWNVSTGTATVVVTRGGVASAPSPVQVGPFSPGIFAINNIAVAILPDGSLAAPPGAIPGINTRPARAGDVLIILGTGLGEVDIPIQSGHNSLDALRRTTTNPEVLVGGRPAQVAFSGLSPQFVAVNQLNIVVPEGVTPGSSVPLQIRIGGLTSTDRTTIAVE